MDIQLSTASEQALATLTENDIEERIGTPIPSVTIAAMYPFIFDSIKDPGLSCLLGVDYSGGVTMKFSDGQGTFVAYKDGFGVSGTDIQVRQIIFNNVLSENDPEEKKVLDFLNYSGNNWQCGAAVDG